MPTAGIRDFTFEDAAVLKHALTSELKLMTEKGDTVAGLLAGLNCQVLESCIPTISAAPVSRRSR